jgi:excisionase family DNA binding protein
VTEVRILDADRRPFFTPRGLADYLNVDPRTVRRMLARGVIPSYKIEGARRIDAQDVDARESPVKRRNPSGDIVWVARYTNDDGRRVSAGTFALKREAQAAIDQAYDQPTRVDTDRRLRRRRGRHGIPGRRGRTRRTTTASAASSTSRSKAASSRTGRSATSAAATPSSSSRTCSPNRAGRRAAR